MITPSKKAALKEESDGKRSADPKHATAAEVAAGADTAHLAAIVTSSHDAIITTDPETIIKTWNQGAEKLFGYAMQEAVGQSHMLLIPEEERKRRHDSLDRIMKGEALEPFETRGQRKDGSVVDLFLTISPIRDPGGKIIGASKIARDITPERLRRQREAFHLKLSDALRQLNDPLAIQETAAQLVVEELNVVRAGYATISPDLHYATVECDHTVGVPSMVGTHGLAGYGPEAFKALLIGEPFIMNDAQNDPRLTPDERTAYAAIQAAAMLVVPLLKEGRWVASFSAHSAIPREWAPQEITLLQQVAERTWVFLQQAKSEQALSASEARYRTLFTTMNEGFCVIEMLYDDAGAPIDYRFLEVNNAFEAQTGLHGAQGKTMGELVPGNNQHWLDIFDKVARTGIPVSVEQESKALGRWFKVYAHRLGGEGQHLAVLFNDITARKKSEDDQRDSEARMTAMFGTALDCIISMDHHGFITEFNASAESTFGHKQADVIGKELAAVIIPPQYRDRHRKGMAHYFATGVGPVLNQRLELSALRADGSEFPCELSVTRIPIGGPPVFTAYLRDITDRKRAEEDLRNVAGELHEADRRKNEFLAMLAHELRNPLAPLRAGLDILDEGGSQDPEMVQVRTMMKRQMNQMVRLVDDLLDVSRVSRGKISLRKAQVDLGTIAQQAIEATRPMREAAEQHLEVFMPSQPLLIHGDGARLVQVISNLLGNASKFSDRKGRIELTSRTDGKNHVVISVKDEGIGISAEQLPKIFELFVQVDTSLERTVSGLGIGLTLVEKLVALHGGTIEARSEGLGKGSEFVVRLPVG